MLASLFGRSRTHPGTRSVKEPGHATPAETGCHPSPGDAEVDPHGASLALRTPASQVICPTSHSGGLDVPHRSPPDPRSHHTRRGLERLPSPKPGGTCLAWQSSETPTAAPHQMRGAGGGPCPGPAGGPFLGTRARRRLFEPAPPPPRGSAPSRSLSSLSKQGRGPRAHVVSEEVVPLGPWRREQPLDVAWHRDDGGRPHSAQTDRGPPPKRHCSGGYPPARPRGLSGFSRNTRRTRRSVTHGDGGSRSRRGIETETAPAEVPSARPRFCVGGGAPHTHTHWPGLRGRRRGGHWPPPFPPAGGGDAAAFPLLAKPCGIVIDIYYRFRQSDLLLPLH